MFLEMCLKTEELAKAHDKICYLYEMPDGTLLASLYYLHTEWLFKAYPGGRTLLSLQGEKFVAEESLEQKQHSVMARRSPKFKLQMWKDNPRCHWCGRITIIHEQIDGESIPENAATIDHLYTKRDPRREYYRKNKIQSPVVLACRSCNERRADEIFLGEFSTEELLKALGEK